jgi:hypothetical protein
MKTPNSIFDPHHHSWIERAQLTRRLQNDVDAACAQLGLPAMQEYTVWYEQGNLQIKTSASFTTRLRQVEPDLLDFLASNDWVVNKISYVCTKNTSHIKQHLLKNVWLNPNIAKYGKRIKPSAEQRALLKIR